MTKGEKQTGTTQEDICGIIMPIGDCEPYRPGHWDNVREILKEAITDAGFKPRMVSEGPDSHIIQSLIVQNIYSNQMIVCDVSSKNANVMLELGLRLALDRPVVVIKDDLTNYSFDTSPIYHVGYPSDLRYEKMIAFKEELKDKILQAKKAVEDKEYKSFFATFGPIPEVKQSDVSGYEVVSRQIAELRSMLTAREIGGGRYKVRSPIASADALMQSPRIPIKDNNQSPQTVMAAVQTLLAKHPGVIADFDFTNGKFSVSLLGPPKEVHGAMVSLDHWLSNR